MCICIRIICTGHTLLRLKSTQVQVLDNSTAIHSGTSMYSVVALSSDPQQDSRTGRGQGGICYLRQLCAEGDAVVVRATLPLSKQDSSELTIPAGNPALHARVWQVMSYTYSSRPRCPYSGIYAVSYLAPVG